MYDHTRKSQCPNKFFHLYPLFIIEISHTKYIFKPRLKKKKKMVTHSIKYNII